MNINNLKDLDDETRKKIEELQKVTRKSESDESFSFAQRQLAEIYYRYGLLDEAIRVSKLIKPQDSKEYYQKAQYNIGAAYDEQGNTSEALKVWFKIKKWDFPDIYARVQYNTGVILSDEGKFEEAKAAWKNVKKEDYPEAYAKAQANIASLFLKEGKEDDANQAWDNVEKNDFPEAYARAQFNLGISLNLKGNTNEALGVWDAIEAKDSLEIFNLAQYNICTALMENTQYRDIGKAKKTLDKIVSGYGYESICLTKIFMLIEHSATKDIGEYLLLLFIQVSKIIEVLTVDFSHRVTEDKPVERKLAHYTGTEITNLLLADGENNKPPSSFRLNTINNVNDPSEGKLLLNYLKEAREEMSYSSQFDEDLHAFISCFTFNHDSLNQFRLYGKQDNKEASGISLVLNQNFFQKHNNTAGLSFVAFKGNLQKIKLTSIQGSTEEKAVEKIKKQPVMRCVYLDPTSSYIHLAQRNRLTFFREFNDETIQVGNEQIHKAEHEWKSYQSFIDKKTEEFSIAFIELKSDYKAIIKKLIKIDKVNPSLSGKIEILLNDILLPLKYLIKHSAFQEEQECRMVYMTSLDDEKVKMDFGKFLYVEYEADVRDNLDKIYIAPAATQYQPYLAKLLCKSQNKNKVRIDLSNNPYRQT